MFAQARKTISTTNNHDIIVTGHDHDNMAYLLVFLALLILFLGVQKGLPYVILLVLVEIGLLAQAVMLLVLNVRF